MAGVPAHRGRVVILRALLGDRYDAVIDKAMAAPKFYASRQYTIRDRVADTLAAVLPDLLADAWDEGHADGLHNAHEHREHRKARNPYRPETTAGRPEPALGPTNSPNPTPSATRPPTEPHNIEGASQ